MRGSHFLGNRGDASRTQVLVGTILASLVVRRKGYASCSEWRVCAHSPKGRPKGAAAAQEIRWRY